MKVTKLVREHIEDKINKLYQPTLDKISKEVESLQDTGRNEREKLKSKAEKVMKDFLKKEGFITKDTSSVLSFYWVQPKDIADKIEKLALKKQELKTKRDNTIMSILLELELGGDKNTLDMLLEKAVLDFNN